MPQLRTLQEKYSRQMVVLGVDAGEKGDSEASRAALGIAAARRNQLNYPVLLNGDPVMEQYEASGFPTTYLIDPAGRIVVAEVGANPGLWPRVEAAVAAFQPPAEADREGTGGPRKAAQILHELTFPIPPGPHEWIVGRDVAIRFQRPEGILADLVAFSVDGKPVAAFGPGSSYTWDATTVSDGPHTLRIAAQTASGRETWAVQQMVIVDNRAPIETTAPPAVQHSTGGSAKTRKVAKARKG
jgi:hypothetical protein